MNVSNLQNTLTYNTSVKNAGNGSGKKGEFRARLFSAYQYTNSDRVSLSESARQLLDSPLLTNEDIQYLADKYNPEHMTQDEYDGLLDYLQERGVIDKNEKRCLGYKGMVAVDPNVSTIDPSTGSDTSRLFENGLNGNRLRHVKDMVLAKYYTQTESGKRYAQNMLLSYGKLKRVMEEIAAQR